MPRGRLETTKVKKALRAATIESEAIQLASAKIKRKFEQNKPLELSFKESLSKMVDRIDPLELAAIGAGTILIHTGILASETIVHDLVEKFKAKETGELIASYYTAVIFPFKPIWDELLPKNLNPSDPLGKTSSSGVQAGLTAKAPIDAKLASSQKPFSPNDSWEIWVLSFVLSFFVMRFGADILKSGIGSITSMLPLLGL